MVPARRRKTRRMTLAIPTANAVRPRPVLLRPGRGLDRRHRVVISLALEDCFPFHRPTCCLSVEGAFAGFAAAFASLLPFSVPSRSIVFANQAVHCQESRMLEFGCSTDRYKGGRCRIAELTDRDCRPASRRLSRRRPAPGPRSAASPSPRRSAAAWRTTAIPARLPAARPPTGSCPTGWPAPPASASAAVRARTSASISAYSPSMRAYSSRNFGSSIKRAFRSFSFVMASPASSVPWRSQAPGAASSATSSRRRAAQPPAVPPPSRRCPWRSLPRP